jgi:hypothetical protein
MNNRHLEVSLHLANAVISAAAPFVLDPVTAGLMLAAISVALALCSGLRCGWPPVFRRLSRQLCPQKTSRISGVRHARWPNPQARRTIRPRRRLRSSVGRRKYGRRGAANGPNRPRLCKNFRAFSHEPVSFAFARPQSVQSRKNREKSCSA